MAKTDLLAIAPLASQPLKNSKHERYCRLRAALQPRAQAYREAGWNDRRDTGAYNHACRLESRPEVAARIDYLSHQAEELIAKKRQRIEAMLWNIHEADIGDCFELVEVAKSKDGKVQTDEAGKMLTVKKQRPKLLSDLPSELRKCIEDVTVDRNGNFVPKLYSRERANKGLRELLALGAQDNRPENDVSRLSDAELIRQLADQAKQLGVKIDLSYDFGQQSDE